MVSVHMRVVVTMLALLLAACGAPPPPESPAPKVTVARPLVREITDYLEFTGTTEASAHVEVRARVAGVLESMHFKPGSRVSRGDLLFVIEPAEYQAALQAAQAELEGAKANYERADIEYARAQKLLKEKAGSEADVVKWRVDREIARADILRAEARVARAEIDMSYTRVVAPLSGRVGRDQVDVGNLVGEGEATILTDITHYDPIYAYYNVNERDLLRIMELYRRHLEELGGDADGADSEEVRLPLQLGLANEEGYPHEGVYDFSESGVDPETGTLRMRGVFANPGAAPMLLPGLFVRIRMPLGQRPDMLLVSERAIAADQSGTYLLVINSKDVVERHSVTTGRRIDGLIVIEEGLRKDERVIVDGLQRARPGRAVTPEEVDMATLTTEALQKAAREAEAAATESRPAGEAGAQGARQSQ